MKISSSLKYLSFISVITMLFGVFATNCISLSILPAIAAMLLIVASDYFKERGQ